LQNLDKTSLFLLQPFSNTNVAGRALPADNTSVLVKDWNRVDSNPEIAAIVAPVAKLKTDSVQVSALSLERFPERFHIVRVHQFERQFANPILRLKSK